MKAGFIGLGIQGAGMAEMIAKAGHELTIWARRPGVVDPYVEFGAKVAETPADLGKACEVVCLCVVSDSDVEDVVYGQGLLDAMQPGSVLVIHSTVRPETCRAIAERAAKRDIYVLDAPVSGSSIGARARTLLVMVGGEASAVAQASPVFESYSQAIVHVGAIGHGQHAKVLNNLLFTANAELARQALLLGERIGADREGLQACFLAGSAQSFALQHLTGLLSPKVAHHLATILNKDIAIMGEIAREAGAEFGPLEGIAQGMLGEFERLKSVTA